MRRHIGQPSPSSPFHGWVSSVGRHCGRLTRDRRGVTAVEYGMMAALIASALVAGIKPLRTGLIIEFNHIANIMSGTAPNPSRP